MSNKDKMTKDINKLFKDDSQWHIYDENMKIVEIEFFNNLIIEIISKIMIDDNDINLQDLGVYLKNNIKYTLKILKNGKMRTRNINNFIKIHYGSLKNLCIIINNQ